MDDKPMGNVEEATRADLRTRGISIEGSAQAALAVSLARKVDQEADSKASAALARELRASIAEIVKATPVVPKASALDELQARRASRRGA